MTLLQKSFFVLILPLLFTCCTEDEDIGKTEITRWQYGKNGAVSLTYDDGSINQFRLAMPIMNRLGFPATFYIVTGQIQGSQYPAKFIGRPVKEIIQETATIPTNEENFFERASAIGFSSYQGTLEFHRQAGQLFEQGKIKEAYQVIDEAYAKIRDGAFNPEREVSQEAAQTGESSWDDFRAYAAQGHEFGSHTISHPRLAVLDEANLRYELEKSKADILQQLGEEHTFSAEAPFGTEDERVMEYALPMFPALRNRMPHPFLQELNRSSKTSPGAAKKEYVQWQRGALTDTPMELMKSWVDTTAAKDNIWLVLVFHGVEGIGWQPIPIDKLEDYFEYIKSKEDKLWIATFKDVTKYMRERMQAEVAHAHTGDTIAIKLTHRLDPDLYDLDLTLKTYVPQSWRTVTIQQDEKRSQVQSSSDQTGAYVIYQASPNAGPVKLTPVAS